MTPANILLLLAFQLLGEILHRVMLVPLSGPLLGMVLLFLALVASGGPSPGLQATTRPLLACLALLFVPAGVGLISHLDLLKAFWLPIVVATLGGALASMLATAGTLLLVERLAARFSRKPGSSEADDMPLKTTPALRRLGGDRT